MEGAKGSRAKYQAMSPEPDSSLVPRMQRQFAFRGTPRSFTAFMASREAAMGPLSSSVPRPKIIPSATLGLYGWVTVQPSPGATTSRWPRMCSASGLSFRSTVPT